MLLHSKSSRTAVAAVPCLSVVVLTWNEERNIEACLRSLARQTNHDFEVVVVDAASTDATTKIVERLRPSFPVPLRLHVAPTRLRVGPARNLGVALSHADTIAFLSADAEAHDGWVEEAIHSLFFSDVTFGRQVHAPTHTSLGGAVRGLRYHFPDRETTQPERYASNVNAVIRRSVLESFPFGSTVGESAVDDLLLTKRSAQAGHKIRYNPKMVVRHRDVDSGRAEFVKNLREGLGWGEHVGELGVHRPMLAWAVLVMAAAFSVAFAPGFVSVAILVLVLYAPVLRRAWRRLPVTRAWLLGVAVSPVFDLAFLVAYLHGLTIRRPTRGTEIPYTETSK